MANIEKNYYLQGNQDFNDRQKSVFSALDVLSAEQPEHRYKSDELKKANVVILKDKKDLKHFQGQESIFKRPYVSLKKSTKIKIPEFIKNPHKWKKYTLGDVEISDQSNRMVALSFLKDLRERSSSVKMEEDEVVHKPKFNHYLKDEGTTLIKLDEQNEKPTFLNGKTIMPEYVVGQKLKKETKKKQRPSTSNTLVKLDHLLDEE